MSTALIEKPAAQQPQVVSKKIVVSDPVPMLDTGKFEHMQRIAALLANSSLLPEHLRVTKGRQLEHAQIMANAFLVVNQAVRWNMDPFALAAESYVVGGKLAYQGKVVQAIVNKRAGLQGRLKYSFKGDGVHRTITVSGTFEDESEPREVTLSVSQAKTSNDMWTKDPDQKLVYSGVIRWARRFAADVVLGIQTDDEIERQIEHGGQSAPLLIDDTAPKSARIAAMLGAAKDTTAADAGHRDEQQTEIVSSAADETEAVPLIERYRQMIAAADIDALPNIRGDFNTDDGLTPAEKTTLEVEAKARQDALKKR